MALIRVKDKETGHEYNVPEHLFNEEAHTKTTKSPLDSHGDPAAMKPSVKKAQVSTSGHEAQNQPKKEL